MNLLLHMEKELQETNKQEIAGIAIVFIMDKRNSLTTELLRPQHHMMIKRFSTAINCYSFKTYMPQKIKRSKYCHNCRKKSSNYHHKMSMWRGESSIYHSQTKKTNPENTTANKKQLQPNMIQNNTTSLTHWTYLEWIQKLEILHSSKGQMEYLQKVIKSKSVHFTLMSYKSHSLNTSKEVTER